MASEQEISLLDGIGNVHRAWHSWEYAMTKAVSENYDDEKARHCYTKSRDHAYSLGRAINRLDSTSPILFPLDDRKKAYLIEQIRDIARSQDSWKKDIQQWVAWNYNDQASQLCYQHAIDWESDLEQEIEGLDATCTMLLVEGTH